MSPAMTDCAFTFLDLDLVASASGALWWPAARLLCVSDLHLGKSERRARRWGALLPPYDTADTLDRLADEVSRWQPETVVCLGDSFDDPACAEALDAESRDRLHQLGAARIWVWIAGNHDPRGFGGQPAENYNEGPLHFRHVPSPEGAPGEVAGHLHPKLRRPLGGQILSRPCFVHDGRRLILPAFGTYTGGLSVDDPAIAGLLKPEAGRAIITGQPCLELPLAAPVQRRGRAKRLVTACPAEEKLTQGGSN